MLDRPVYEILNVKEEQMRDYVRGAQVDQLRRELESRRESVIARALRVPLNVIGHLLVGTGRRLQAVGSEKVLA